MHSVTGSDIYYLGSPGDSVFFFLQQIFSAASHVGGIYKQGALWLLTYLNKTLMVPVYENPSLRCHRQEVRVPLVRVDLQPAVGVCQALKISSKCMLCSRGSDPGAPDVCQFLEDFLRPLNFLGNALEDSIFLWGEI